MVEIKKYSSGNNSIVTIACGPVIMDGDKILLVKDIEDPFWKIPGGSLIDNESPIETVVREAYEETGLNIEVEGEPFLYSFHMLDEVSNQTKYFILFHYRARVIGDRKLKKEGKRKLEFFELDQLPEDIAPNVAATVSHFFKF